MSTLLLTDWSHQDSTTPGDSDQAKPHALIRAAVAQITIYPAKTTPSYSAPQRWRSRALGKAGDTISTPCIKFRINCRFDFQFSFLLTLPTPWPQHNASAWRIAAASSSIVHHIPESNFSINHGASQLERSPAQHPSTLLLSTTRTTRQSHPEANNCYTSTPNASPNYQPSYTNSTKQCKPRTQDSRTTN